MKKIFTILAGHKKAAVLGFLAIALAIFFSFRFFGKTQNQSTFQKAQVKRGMIISFVSASGQILNSNVINVTTGVSGIVKQIFVSDGDKVAEGDKIAEIELDSAGQQKNASAWSSYLSAKNALESVKATQYSLQSDMFAKWKIFKDLAESSSYDTTEERTLPQFHIAQKDWLAAEAKYKNQENVIIQAQAALNSSWLSYQQFSPSITAPASGTVENITVAPGMILRGQGASSTSGESSLSQTVAVIQSQGNPLGSFNFSEIDVAKIKTGQKATMIVDAISGKTFTGRVVAIDKIGQIVNNVTNYPVIVQFDASPPELLPNMVASVSITLETKNNALIVPSQAVQTINEQTVVRAVRNGRIEFVSVEVGISGDQGTEILSGLSEKDEVIVGATGTIGQQGGASPFGGFGGTVLRPGGFSGGRR